MASTLFIFDVALVVQPRRSTTTAASELLLLLVEDEALNVVAPFSFVVSYDASQLTIVGDTISSNELTPSMGEANSFILFVPLIFRLCAST